MNKVTLTEVDQTGVPTFASAAFSPDNSQNARRYFNALLSEEFPLGYNVEVSEFTAPSEKGGVGKAVCRVRYSLPQMKAAGTYAGQSATTVVQTGQAEYLQAVATITLPPMWAKMMLLQVPVSDVLRLQIAALCRAAILDAMMGLVGDLKPSAAFPASAWTTQLSPASPLFRGLQGANPEDVFTGAYGVAP